MKYIIWGAGELGKRLYYHLKKTDVIAFIDKDSKKQGKMYCDKPIISFTEYKERYSDCYIIVSIMIETDVIKILNKNSVSKYFLLSECPGEFQEPYSRDILEQYIFEYVKNEKEYIIYGCTLYAIELCRWIECKTGRQVHIIPHKEVDANLLINLRKDLPADTIRDFDNCILKNVDEILVTVERDMKYLEGCIKSRAVLTNVYDCSDVIAEYYNPQISKYKNLHVNKRCFIIGTGPSLKMEDLDALYDNREICFGVNDIFRAYDRTKWRPDYYVITDHLAIVESNGLHYTADSERFVSDCCIPYLTEENSDVVIFHTQYELFQNRTPKFSENFAQKSYLGGTVVYACIQLAVFMGFSEIYLLGVDCNYVKDENVKNYFYDNVGDNDVPYNIDEMVACMVLAYGSARSYADSHGIKIMNATRGGKLEIFERVVFDALLGKDKMV